VGKLGLDALSNDQLLALIEETAEELIARDPWIRNMAQATLTTAAERLALRRGALEEAIQETARAFVLSIKAEEVAALREALANGTARLLTSEQEARAVVDATLQARIALIDETVKVIQTGKVAGMGPYTPPPFMPDDDPGLHDYGENLTGNAWSAAQAAGHAQASNAKIGQKIKLQQPPRFRFRKP
jgi:hypothetical protein